MLTYLGPLIRRTLIAVCSVLLSGLSPRDAEAIVQAPAKHARISTEYKGVRSSVVPRYHWPDERRLEQYAAVWDVDARVAKAMAWQESGANLDPSLRGHRCWYDHRTVIILPDGSPYIVRVEHHESNCEVGRFQIRPTTAAWRCKGINIFTREGNYHCYFKMFSEDSSSHGIEAAIRKHNGRGPMTVVYLASVKTIVRRTM